MAVLGPSSDDCTAEITRLREHFEGIIARESGKRARAEDEVERLRKLLLDSRWIGRAEKAEAEIERLREALQNAEAAAADYEAWLEKALTALGVKTVFDIPEEADRA